MKMRQSTMVSFMLACVIPIVTASLTNSPSIIAGPKTSSTPTKSSSSSTLSRDTQLPRIGKFVASGIGISTSAASTTSTTSSKDAAKTNIVSSSGTPTSKQSATTSLITSAVGDNLSQCLSKASSWSAAFDSFYQQQQGSSASFTATTVKTETTSSTEFWEKLGPPYTTLCDGYPRVKGIPSTSIGLATITQKETATFGTPFPSCALNSQDCAGFYNTRSSCSGVLSTTNAPSILSACEPYIGETLCPKPGAPVTSTSSCIVCEIIASGVRLHYWPVTTTNGNVCDKPGTTISAKQGKRVATVQGTVITSPTIAIEIASINAGHECGGTTSYDKAQSNVVLTLAADQLSSAVPAPHLLGSQYPFNYADLIPGQVPFSAWTRQADWQAQCTLTPAKAPFCSTIYVDDYKPILVAPSQVHQLDPKWSECYALFGLNDPPVALTTTDVAEGPTGPTPSPTSTPSPSQSAQPAPSPTQTVGPGPTSSVTQSQPSKASDQLSSTNNLPTSTVSDPGNANPGNTNIVNTNSGDPSSGDSNPGNTGVSGTNAKDPNTGNTTPTNTAGQTQPNPSSGDNNPAAFSQTPPTGPSNNSQPTNPTPSPSPNVALSSQISILTTPTTLSAGQTILISSKTQILSSATVLASGQTLLVAGSSSADTAVSTGSAVTRPSGQYSGGGPGGSGGNISSTGVVATNGALWMGRNVGWSAGLGVVVGVLALGR